MPIGLGSHMWLILILLIVVLIIWGPGKLPDVGSGLGRAIKEFKKASTDTKDSFDKAIAADVPATPTATTPASAEEPKVSA